MKSYHDLLQRILDNGEHHADRTNVGTISTFGETWDHDMRTGFPLMSTKRVPLRWVFEEIMWMLRGETNNAKLKAMGVDIWDEWSDEAHTSKFGRKVDDLGPIYGWQWRRFGAPYGPLHDSSVIGQGFDQIKQLLEDIAKSPNSRRLIVSGWNPSQTKLVDLPPCHTMWQVKVYQESEEISLCMYARSIDAFLGLPFNICQYGLILTMLGWLFNLKPRMLHIRFGDCHIYQNHLKQVHIQLEREPFPLPTVTIRKNYDGFGTMLENWMGLEWKDIKLEGYKHHPKIEADVAV